MNPETDVFDFNQYYAKPSKNDALSSPVESQPNGQDEPFDFAQYAPKEPETNLGTAKRHLARTGARAAETVLGLPGDVVQLSKYIGGKLPEPPKFLQREPNFAQKAGQNLLEKLPTSRELKEKTNELTSGYTKAQGAGEEIADDITSLATSLMIPTKDITKLKGFASGLGKNILRAGASKGAGKAAELYGASEGQKTAVEIGTLLLTSFINPGAANKYISDKYETARAAIPKGDMVQTAGLSKALNDLETKLAKGIPTATKDEVLAKIAPLKAKAAGGAMEADELVEAYHNINENMTSKKLFDELNTGQRKLLKHRYDEFKTEVDKVIDAYGQHNPKFYSEWRGANEGFKTMAESKNVSNFLFRNKYKLPSHLATGLAVELFTGHPLIALATGGAAAAGFSAIKTGEFLYRIAKSPTLRKHYGEVIREANHENLPAVIRHLEALK